MYALYDLPSSINTITSYLETLNTVFIVLAIISLAAWVYAIRMLIDLAKFKGYFADGGTGGLWFVGLFATPVVLAIYVAALPDKPNRTPSRGLDEAKDIPKLIDTYPICMTWKGGGVPVNDYSFDVDVSIGSHHLTHEVAKDSGSYYLVKNDQFTLWSAHDVIDGNVYLFGLSGASSTGTMPIKASISDDYGVDADVFSKTISW